MIKPHGGRLVNRIVEDKEHDLLEDKSSGLSKIVLNSREISDLEMIATGAMSPLEGFMTKEDYINVLDLKRLAKGLPWTIPVTLAVKNGNGEEYKEGSDVAMYDQENNLLGVFPLEEKYEVDKEHEAESVLLTTDAAHPGVQYLNTIGNK